MATKRCLACGVVFPLRAQSPHQSYCSSPACQRNRRKVWQREHRQLDEDYKDNQSRAHERWLSKNPEYWQNYRSTHPDYVERNRDQQRERRRAKASSALANMDSSMPVPPSGVYRLTRASEDVANMDSWIVEIRVLSKE